jgi:hypothetical protein
MMGPNVVALAETIRAGKLDDLDPAAILHMWAEAILTDRDRGKTFASPSGRPSTTSPKEPSHEHHTQALQARWTRDRVLRVGRFVHVRGRRHRA